MDLFSAIYAIKNLNGYIAVTEEYAGRSLTNLKVPLNTATVLALKKVRSIEIEYFNKRDENGIACTLLQNLLCIPPSKVWGLLAKELIHLLQYWLDAIRKHLINHTTHWWMFLSLLLKFIEDIYLKDTNIPDLLVEFTAECLFDLATASKPDVYQRHEILHCLNMVCAASSREVRFAFRTKFADCFVKLASGMSISGFLPYQYSALECLLRWLLPRQEVRLRALALDKWFPRDLCPDAARALFLNSNWMSFLQDARDFLNALNEGNGLLTSVMCRHLTIGQIVVINSTKRQVNWMDFNTSVKCVSVLLDPQELVVFGVKGHRACESLLIHDEITETAVLRRESLGLTISLELLRAPSIRPHVANVNGQHVTAIVSSRTDLRALDRAMRTTFGDKYQLLLDLDMEVSQSPQLSSCKIKTGNYSEDDTRFSHPVEVKRNKRAGYIVRSKFGEGIASPSTASTSSIKHLKEKLVALPRGPGFCKDPVQVIAEPSLSKVSESYEPNNRGLKSFQRKAFPKPPPEAKSRSDGETERTRNRGVRRDLHPVVSDDNAESIFPLGSYDTVIFENIETLPNDYATEDIVDALSREAMLAIPPKDNSGVNKDEKKSQEESEAIEDTPKEIREARNRLPYKPPCIISTTDDESNTEAINETPAIVHRKKTPIRSRPTPNLEEKKTFDVITVEDFFSQHVAQNQRGEIVISPRLAKKINEYSSETSDHYFDDNNLLLNEEIPMDIEQRIFDDVAIIDCLNEMIDTVCRDFDNYTANLFRENISEYIDHQDMSNVEDGVKPKPKPKSKNIKLKYKPVKKAKPRVTKKSKAVQPKNAKKMSIIIEQKDEEMNQESRDLEKHVEVVKISPERAETPKNKETPLIKRKRKLYSPKEYAMEEDVVQSNEELTSDDVPLSKKIKNDSSKAQATATCYKEIEKERKKYTRLPRIRKSKGNTTETPSPRTAKMNTAFDNLKNTKESNETIRLASKGDNVYNFSSDSEDEEFKKKKIEIKKRISVQPKAKVKNARRGKVSDTSNEDTDTKPVKRKTTKRTTKQKAVDKTAVIDFVKIDLVDEKIREAVREQLNTSIVIEPPTNLEPVELEPMLPQAPQLEHIQESKSIDTVVTKKKNTKTERQYHIEPNEKNKTKELEIHDSASNSSLISKKNENKRTKKTKVVIKREKGAKKVKTNVLPDNDDGTSSPLPGLLVEESKPKSNDDINDSLNTNMLQKFKKIFRDGHEANDSVLTQNMLSDVDKPNFTGQNDNNLLDEICFADYDRVVAEKAKKRNTNIVQKVTKKKTVTKEINEVIEIAEIESVYDIQSDISIATDGITAHGDDDEVPPPAESIEETFEPRELQDLSSSMKEYFKKLTREMHASKSSAESNKSAKETSEADNMSGRSPIVSVKRLSLDDISKWMPSRRTSDTDSPQASSKIISDKNIIDSPSSAKSRVENTLIGKTKTSTLVKTRRDTFKPVKVISPKSPLANLRKLKSPSVAVARISQEEFDKWFPPLPISEAENNSSTKTHRRESKLIYPTTSKSKVTDKEIRNVNQKEKSITKTSKVQKPVETIIQTDTNDSDIIETNVSIIRTRSKTTLREASQKRQPLDSYTEQSRPKEPKNKERIQINTKPAPAEPAVRKSIISPIKLFGNFTPILDTVNSLVNENATNVSPKPRESQLRKSKSNVSKADTFTSRESSKRETRKRSKSPIISVPKRKNVSRTRFDEIRHSGKPNKFMIEPKRLFDAPEVLEDVSIPTSGPSSSSVNDWFKKTAPFVNDPTMSMEETIQNVMERLDTTFAEVNHNTSKKLVNLFMEAQTEIRTMFERLSEFQEKFQTQALQLMRDDCQRRRAMVVLVKEDLQALLNRTRKKN